MKLKGKADPSETAAWSSPNTQQAEAPGFAFLVVLGFTAIAELGRSLCKCYSLFYLTYLTADESRHDSYHRAQKVMSILKLFPHLAKTSPPLLLDMWHFSLR